MASVVLAGGAFHELSKLLALDPAYLPHAMALFGFAFAVNYLLRTALLIEAPLSRWVHMAVCTLTMLPAFVLAAALWWAAYRHPERAWINLGVAAALYVAWWFGGFMTRLARPDTEGGDVGWLTMGALVTFPVGVIAALIYG
jgi:hypothetical protein